MTACSPGARSATSKWNFSCNESKIESSGNTCFQSEPSTEYSIFAILLSASIASPETVAVLRPLRLPSRVEVRRPSTRGGMLSITKGALSRSALISVPSGVSGASLASSLSRYVPFAKDSASQLNARSSVPLESDFHEVSSSALM